jgi:non-ribosomal peptide synthetase component E (peptide arylation enzyme)
LLPDQYLRSFNGAAIRQGLIDSGDLAYIDEESRIYIAGRAKDLIIRSGHNIAPPSMTAPSVTPSQVRCALLLREEIALGAHYCQTPSHTVHRSRSLSPFFGMHGGGSSPESC